MEIGQKVPVSLYTRTYSAINKRITRVVSPSSGNKCLKEDRGAYVNGKEEGE